MRFTSGKKWSKVFNDLHEKSGIKGIMKAKNFIILLTICCVLAIVTFFVFNKKSNTNQQAKLGQKLFDNLQVNDIAKITINSTDGAVILKKEKTFWVVENRFNYPADFSKITDLAKKLKELKIGRRFNASGDIISRLSLHLPDKKEIPPSQKGIQIVLVDKQKKILLDLILGKIRESSSRSGGQYVMLSTTSTVYLVDQNFRFLEKEPKQWLNKDLIDIKAKDIEKVICFTPGREKVIYAIKRPEKEQPPEFVNAPRNRKVETSKINQVVEALTGLKIEDIADPGKNIKQTKFKNTPYFEYFLFDGTVYTIYPGLAMDNDSEKHYYRVYASHIPSQDKEGDVTTDSGEEDKSRQENQAEPSVKVNHLNKKLGSWIYIVSKWENNKFITDPEEFFIKEKVE